MKEGLEVEEGKVELTVIGKEKLIIHGLGNLCLSDCYAKKIPTPVEKQVLQKAGWDLKK